MHLLLMYIDLGLTEIRSQQLVLAALIGCSAQVEQYSLTKGTVAANWHFGTSLEITSWCSLSYSAKENSMQHVHNVCMSILQHIMQFQKPFTTASTQHSQSLQYVVD